MLSVRGCALDGGILTVGLLRLVELDGLAMTLHHSVNIGIVEFGAGFSLELRQQRLIVRGKLGGQGYSDFLRNWLDLFFQSSVVDDRSLAETPYAFSSAFFRGQLSDSHLSNIHLHRRLDEVLVSLGLCECRGAKKQRRRRYAQNVHANSPLKHRGSSFVWTRFNEV